MTQAEQLRAWCAEVRRKPMPLADAVPMVQESADRIEALEAALREALVVAEARKASNTMSAAEWFKRNEGWQANARALLGIKGEVK